MAKWVLLSILFLFILLINGVYALDCQYQEQEVYFEEAEFYYHNGEDIGMNLNLTELIIFEVSSSEIKITNNLEVPITLNVTYKRYSNFFGIDDEPTTEITIKANDFERIISNLPYITNVVKYSFIEPNLITHETERLKKFRTICKICPLGEECLNEGVQCNLDSQCGSGICDIAGLCGKEKIVACEAYGKLNCNNQSCLIPSVKKAGEAYSCEWECEYGGENGKCLENPVLIKEREDQIKKRWVLFGAAIIILTSFGIWYLGKKKADEEEKRAEKAREERAKEEEKTKTLRKEAERLNSEIESKRKEITKLNKDKDNAETKIIQLKEKVKKAHGEAKKKFEEELDIEKNKQAVRINIIKTKNEELIKKENELAQKERRIEERRKIIEEKIKQRDKLAETSKQNTQNEIEAALEKYGRKYGKSRLFYDEKTGYIKFKQGKDLHRYIYQSKFGLGEGYEVHHIDNDKLNNEIWNLIALKEEKHNKRFAKFNHGKIEFQDWNSGIKQLKEQLDMKDSDFPEHIQKHIKELKEQKKLD